MRRTYDERTEKHKKREPWRIVVAGLSIAYIVFMWVRKDIVTIYSTMPKEQVVPMIATTVVVTLVKVAAIAAVVLVVKRVVKK